MLIGDAAHAIVPFYGQGMNCGFEDCRILDELIEKHEDDWQSILQNYQMLRKPDADQLQALDPNSYAFSQALAMQLRTAGSDGLVCPSARQKGGECVALFYPDLATNAVQGRHLDYHWNGRRVDLYRNPGNAQVFRIVPDHEGLEVQVRFETNRVCFPSTQLA